MSDIGSLRFIAKTTHPGIAHIVGILGRHLHNPSHRHVEALKPIYRYLSSRVDDGITYDKKGPLDFTCYTDSDLAGCKDTRRSVFGCLLMANGQPVLWSAGLQAVPAHSSTQIEYVAANIGARNLTWASTMANEMHIPMLKQKATLIIDTKPSTKYHEGEIIQNQANDLHLLVDNKGAFDIANSYGPSKRTKNMEVRHHFLQHQIKDKVIHMTQYQLQSN